MYALCGRPTRSSLPDTGPEAFRRQKLSTGQFLRGTEQKSVSAVPADVVPKIAQLKVYSSLDDGKSPHRTGFSHRGRPCYSVQQIPSGIAHKIPAGILLPLAELILGKGISPVATGDQGLCPLDPASLERLERTFLDMNAPTECVKLALALRSHKPPDSVYEVLQ